MLRLLAAEPSQYLVTTEPCCWPGGAGLRQGEQDPRRGGAHQPRGLHAVCPGHAPPRLRVQRHGRGHPAAQPPQDQEAAGAQPEVRDADIWTPSSNNPPRKSPGPGTSPGPTKGRGPPSAEADSSCSMLACFCSDKRGDPERADADKMDKVEFAFRKFDFDGDGYLSWEEFQQV